MKKSALAFLTIPVTFLALILAGCATTEKANLSGYDKPVFPITTLVFTSESLQYSAARYAFIDALKESKAFESLDIENPYSRYALEVNLDYSNKIDNAAEAVVTGAMLGSMVLPVRMDYIVTGDIKLRENNQVIDYFTIEFEHRRIQTLFQAPSKDGGWSGALRVAAQKMIEHLDSRNSYYPSKEEKDALNLAGRF
jgi:hypothetical protein